MARVLVVDDDKQFCNLLSEHVRRLGHDAARVYSLSEAREKIQARTYDVVFLDVNLPDGSGLDVIPEFHEVEYEPEIIIITGFGGKNGAELAIKSGAWDYINKTSSMDSITLSLTRALQYREGKLNAAKPVALKTENIIASSPKMRHCLDLVAQAAAVDTSVLITGETGTGKELIAGAIHENSSRAHKNFVVVDCTALPETLAESALLGHEKGSFTGADQARGGLIRQADGGTLFLDEIGDLKLPIQKVLLRALQERRYRPVGSDEEVESDFRLVAATHFNLKKMAEEGLFREDLLFRLKALSIELPPLRKRPEDIKLISIHHVARLCEKYNMETKGFSPGFFESLSAYDWPGNVRELLNALDGALAVAGNEPALFSRCLPAEIRIHMAQASFKDAEGSGPSSSTIPDLSGPLPKLKDFKNSMEELYLKELLVKVGGNTKEACRISGLSRSRFYELLKKQGLSSPK